jgi:hypothetical protein
MRGRETSTESYLNYLSFSYGIVILENNLMGVENACPGLGKDRTEEKREEEATLVLSGTNVAAA